MGFDGPDAHLFSIAGLLADLPCRWAVCGGWAIDLFLDRCTRPHKDVDVAVFRPDQLVARRYLAARGWAFRKIVEGRSLSWAEAELIELPIHEVWCDNPAFVPGRVELLFNETDGSTFRFRRDPSAALPIDRAVIPSASGLFVLAPEVVLLYKAKNAEHPNNAADFKSVLPHLGPESRAWLGGSLTKVLPGHPWINRL